MSEQLLNALDRYYDTFGEGFPTMPLLESGTEEEAIEIIERCVSEKKDVYELGYLTLDFDVIY